MMVRGISRKIIAFVSLLVFFLTIYGTAFGAIGCHSAGKGFQYLESNKSHQQIDVPHLNIDYGNPCACDPLTCQCI